MSVKRTPAPKSLPIWVRITIVGVIAFAGIAGTLAYRDVLRQPAEDAPRVEFTVEGLDCPVWCAVRLSNSIDSLDGARVESIDQKTGKVIVRHDPARQNVEVLRKLIDARGFAVQASEPVEKR
ncbi:MAG TPA: copper chaperone [Planctomycetes bacterium]|nr:copper chaperone [Planctomycetota bacterium]